MTTNSGSTYGVFRTLAHAMEIRKNSPADRDRHLYDKVRDCLSMGSLRPKAFFCANPHVTDANVLAAFLETLEPFALDANEFDENMNAIAQPEFVT